MTTTLRLMTLPLLLTVSCLCTQVQKLDITGNTRWQNSPDLKFVKGTVRFQPLIDFGDGSREAPKIILDFLFENQGTRAIQRIDFEVVAYHSAIEPSKSKDFKIKQYTYTSGLSANETGGMSVDWTDMEMALPERQTVRVARVLYADGTVWQRRGEKAQED
jgi:hypothetical protein